MHRVIAVTSVVLTSAVVGIASGGVAYAANPPGTGQPSQSCGSDMAPDSPAGFNTQGFSNAESVYAGSDGTPSANHANSGAAVSQYDVACFQVSTH
jgi:hypothetical protein